MAATTHFRTEELAPGVHVALAIPGAGALCNAAIIDLGGATVVFDAMLTPGAGEALRLAARRLTGRSPDYLVQSHYHGDHIRGSEALGAVRAVSTRATRALIAERGAAQLAEDREEAAHDLAELRAGGGSYNADERADYEGWFEAILATPQDLPFRLAELTFERDLTIHGSRGQITVRSYGGGHSPSDAFALLEDERLAFLGDLFSVGYHPYLTDGDPDRFEEIVHRIRQHAIDRALPGHGPVGGPAELERMEAYLRHVRSRAAQARSEGRGEAELLLERAPPPYDTWRFSQQYVRNLAYTYRRQGDGALGPRST